LYLYHSRACNVEISGESALALVPSFDLMNHHHSAGDTHMASDGDRQVLVLTSGGEFGQGQQVYINCKLEVLLLLLLLILLILPLLIHST